MSISPFLSISHPCDEAFQWTSTQLTQAGLRLVRTFDLHVARVGSHHCTCPSHGTEECDCQMIVALVYGQSEEPITLILHGNNGQTWLSIAEDPHQEPDLELSTSIKQALETALMTTPETG